MRSVCPRATAYVKNAPRPREEALEYVPGAKAHHVTLPALPQARVLAHLVATGGAAVDLHRLSLRLYRTTRDRFLATVLETPDGQETRTDCPLRAPTACRVGSTERHGPRSADLGGSY
jgi:hypothetical protein